MMALNTYTNFWQNITAPSGTITDIQQRRQSRLLAGMLALFMAALTPLAIWTTVTAPGRGMTIQNLLILYAALALTAVHYILNRQGHYTLSASAFVLTAFLVIHVLGLTGIGKISTLYYAILVMLIGAFLLSIRQTFLLFLVSVAFQLIVQAAFPRTAVVTNGEPLLFVIITTLLLFVFLQHRNALEEERQAELRAANEALRESEASLEKRVADRTRDLRIAADVSRQITTILNLNELLQAVAERTRAAFNLYHVSVFLYDPASQTLTLEAATGQAGEAMQAENRRFALTSAQGTVSQSALTRRAVVVNDIGTGMSFATSPHLPETHAELSLPMVVGSQLVGVLNCHSEVVARFNEEDMGVMTTLAEQIAIAVNNATLFRASESARRRAEIISDINSQVGQAEHEEGLLMAVSKIVEPYGMPGASLSYIRLDQFGQMDTVGAIVRIDSNRQSIDERTFTRKIHTAGQYPLVQQVVAQADKPLFIEDVEAETRFTEADRSAIRAMQAKSLLMLPLKSGNRWQGVIAFAWSDAQSFPTDFQELIGVLVPRLADSVAERQAYFRAESERRENERLYHVSQDMNAARSFSEIVAAVATHLDNNAYTILLGVFENYDREQASYYETLAVRAAGSTETVPVNRRQDLALFENWSPYNMMMIEDVTRSNAINPVALETCRANNVRALLLVGLTLSSRVLGVILVNHVLPRRFTQQEQHYLRAVADLAAAAVERIRLYGEQVELVEQLREVDNIKSRFLASMSHELRTPLNAVLNFTKFVSSGMLGQVNEKQVDALNKTIDSGRHLLSLINDVLDITKIESNMLNLFVEADISLADELRSVVAAGESLLHDKPVTLIQEIDPDLPLMVGDKRRIRQILLNLVSNACKFTETGSVTLATHVNGDIVSLYVKDTGPGIPAEDQDLLFQAFRQTRTGLSQGGGTGLGLAIAKRLAEAHGGRLWLESVVGQGSTFFVELPIRSEALLQSMTSTVAK